MPLPRVNRPGSVPADGFSILGNNDAGIVIGARAEGQGRRRSAPGVAEQDVVGDAAIDFFAI